MNVDVRAVVTKWWAEQGIRDPSAIDQEDYAHLRQLLSTERKGFGVFVSLLMFERQQASALLINADLSTSKGAVAAAKLQGTVQCVDNIRELVLNIADPIVEGSDQPRETAGVRFDG